MVRKLEKLVDNYKPKIYPLSYIEDICLQVTIPWAFHQCQQTVEGPKYRFPVQIDFQKCREKIAGSLNEFCNRWCKRENVECDALKDWKLNIFKIIDRRISFYSQNTNMLPRKPKISYRYLKSGIEEFHRKYVLVPADKAANNVVVV